MGENDGGYSQLDAMDVQPSAPPPVVYSFRTAQESDDQSPKPAGAPSQQQAPVAGQAAPGAEGQPPLADKDNPDRFQYWQSRHDRLYQEVAPYVDLLPVARALTMRPDLRAKMEAELMGQPVQYGAPPPPESTTPKVPERPVRPPNYDPTLAFSDPESPHYKYREAEEQYQTKLADYLVSRDQVRERAMQAVIEQMQAERRMQEQSMLLQQHAVIAGVPETEVEDFMQMFTNPDPDVMLRDMAQLYNMRRGRSDNPQIPSATQRAADLLKQRMEGRPPLPLSGAPGAGQPPVADPNKAFSASLKDAARRLNS